MVNVNTVYSTVLLILNKEQRGYMTPQEFNSVADQVQLQIFEQYFEDLNQQLRVPQADVDYADRQMNIDEKLSIFKNSATLSYTSNYFTIPQTITNSLGQIVEFYRLGLVTYTNPFGEVKELERVNRTDFYNAQSSPFLAATDEFPVYLYEGEKLYVSPNNINTSNVISIDFVRKPIAPLWGFTVGNRGQYVYNSEQYDSTANPPSGSIQFELHQSEQTSLILRILAYAGVIVKDPQIIQVATQQVMQDEANAKS